VLDKSRLLVWQFVGLETNVRSCGFGEGSFSFGFGGGRINKIISNKQNRAKEGSRQGKGIYMFEGWIQGKCK
jgi:hypothetical protein